MRLWYTKRLYKYYGHIDPKMSILNALICVLCLFRVLLVLLEPLVLLDFRDSLVCLVLEEIVVHLVVLVVW